MEVGFALRPEDLRAVQTSGPHVVVLDSIPGGESSLSFPPPLGRSYDIMHMHRWWRAENPSENLPL